MANKVEARNVLAALQNITSMQILYENLKSSDFKDVKQWMYAIRIKLIDAIITDTMDAWKAVASMSRQAISKNLEAFKANESLYVAVTLDKARAQM